MFAFLSLSPSTIKKCLEAAKQGHVVVEAKFLAAKANKWLNEDSSDSFSSALSQSYHQQTIQLFSSIEKCFHSLPLPRRRPQLFSE